MRYKHRQFIIIILWNHLLKYSNKHEYFLLFTDNSIQSFLTKPGTF